MLVEWLSLCDVFRDRRDASQCSTSPNLRFSPVMSSLMDVVNWLMRWDLSLNTDLCLTTVCVWGSRVNHGGKQTQRGRETDVWSFL